MNRAIFNNKYKDKLNNGLFKANNITDMRNNLSASNDDFINQASENMLNIDYNNITNIRVSAYRERLRNYQTLYGYSDIYKIIQSHVDSLIIQNYEEDYITLKFTDQGETNLPENIKVEYSNIFRNIFKKILPFESLRQGFVNYFKEGMMAYEVIVDNDGQVTRTRMMKNGYFDAFIWNEEPKFYYEYVGLESITEDDLNSMKEEVSTYLKYQIENEMKMKFSSGGSLNINNNSFNTNFTTSMNQIVKIIPAERVLCMRWNRNVSAEINDTISMLEFVAAPYCRYLTMETHMMGYRLSRSTAQLFINMDLGEMPSTDRRRTISDFLQNYETENVFDPMNNSIGNTYSPSTFKSLIVLPKGGQIGGSSVDTVDFQFAPNQINDVKLLFSKFIYAFDYPFYKVAQLFNMESGSGINTTTAIDNNGLMLEEAAYQNFLNNIRIEFINKFAIKLFQMVNILGNYEPHTVSVENIKITLVEDNKFALYLKKLDMETKMGMVDQMRDFSSVERLCKNVLGMDNAAFSNEITSKIREKETGLDKLFAGEELTFEELAKIKEIYIDGDRSVTISTQRANNTVGNVTAYYNDRKNSHELTAIINHLKGIMRETNIAHTDMIKVSNVRGEYQSNKGRGKR